MRTTLTLDADIAERLKQRASSGKSSFKQLVNEALRRGLGIAPKKREQFYRVKPHSSGFVPGIDPARLNQLADELEAGEFLRKAAPRSGSDDHSGC